MHMQCCLLKGECMKIIDSYLYVQFIYFSLLNFILAHVRNTSDFGMCVMFYFSGDCCCVSNS